MGLAIACLLGGLQVEAANEASTARSDKLTADSVGTHSHHASVRQAAEIRNARAAECRVRCGTKTAPLNLKPDAAVRLNAELTIAN